MSKIASYLSNHLHGEVLTSQAIRRKFSTDGSVLKITPLLVAFPFDTSDVRKITHFAWQLAEKGHTLALTARGSGSNNVGGAIGNGIVMSFPQHLDKILEIDTKQKLARVQPGVSLKNLDTTMRSHGLVWPVDSHTQSATVGGAIGSNLYGAQGGRYGDCGAWIDQLEVVLASGDTIQTKRLSKRELNKKKGITGMEGEIYRELDNLISDHPETIADLAERPGSAGYALAAVKDKAGNFDLTPLIIGSQGTLGIVTEAILRLEHDHPQKEIIAVGLTSTDELEQLVAKLNKLDPTRIEFVDRASLAYATQKLAIKVPQLLPSDEDAPELAGLLVIEVEVTGRLKSKAKKISKLFEKAEHIVTRSDGDLERASEMWQAYNRLVYVLNHTETDDRKVTMPVIEDAIIPLSDITSFVASVHALAKKHRLTLVLWAHLTTGVVHVRPFLNPRHLSDKQKIAKLMSDYYQLVIKTDGSAAGEYGEGRLRTHHASGQFGAEEKALFVAVKKIFDTHNIFNPGVKLAADKDSLSALDESYSH